MNDVSNVLRKAADLLGEHGWCQGEMNKDGKMCAVGAIYTAAGVYSPWGQLIGNPTVGLADRSRNAVAWHLFGHGEYADEEYVSIPQWNDADERTAEDVILALKTTAELVEESA